MPTLYALTALLAFAQTPATAGRDLALKAMQAMGGQAKLESVRKVTVEFASHNYALEESERPEGPWFSTYSRGKVDTDFDSQKIDTQETLSGLLMGGEAPRKMSWTPAKPVSGYWFLGISGPSQLDLSPARLLQTALASADLRTDRPVKYHGIPHDVIRFSWDSVPVRVLINHFTQLPAMVETTDIGQGFWTVWGDVTEQVVYGNWDIAPGGLMLPTLWEVQRNGLPQEDVSILKTEVKYGPSPSKRPPIAHRRPASKPPLMPFKGVELTPGVIQYQSGFNCAAVDQGDGVVILEGVVSTAYMNAVVEDVAKRFPGKPIKAVVTTDDAWPHIGGLRYFVVHRIPIYAMPLNRPILERLFKAPFTTLPDELAKSPTNPVFRFVDGKAEIGKGPNRLVIRPMQGSATERMLYAVLPEQKLLYAPDVIQRSGDQWFSLNLVREMLNTLARDQIEVDKAFAFHSDLIAISELRAAVQKAEG